MRFIFQLLLAILIGVPFAFAVAAWHGLAFSMNWNWFMVPLGVPPITFGHAMGFGVLTGLFLSWLPKISEPKTIWINVLVGPPIAIASGWVITNFFM